MKKALMIGGAGFVTLTGMAITTLIAAAILFGDSRGERIEFKNGELFYTEQVDAHQAQKLADFLQEQYGDLKNKKSIQLDRKDNDVIVRLCAQPSTWQTDDLDYSFQAIEYLMQLEVFKNENVVVELCDPYFKPKKLIDHWSVTDVNAVTSNTN
jgi:hypothetical protein